MLKDKFRNPDLLLLLLYIFYCAAIVLRVSVEGTGYLSPDSEYYLEAARSLKAGEGFFIRDLYGLHSRRTGSIAYFSAWPIGYPTLVALVSLTSGLKLFWASKFINLLFAGLGFLLMRHINRQYAFVLASVYGAFTIIEMYSYTWSECVFMFGCLCFVVLLHEVYISGKVVLVYALLATAIFMFLIRYIGFFSGGLILLLALLTWLDDRKSVSRHLLIAFGLNLLFVCIYVLHNYYVAGYNTDAQRLTENMERPAEVFFMAIKGLVIELFIIRKYYLNGSPGILTVATAVLQFSVIGYIWKLLRAESNRVTGAIKCNTLSHIAILVAFAYLLVLVYLRTISQFDSLDYRLLSPFTFIMLFAVVNYIVALPDQLKGVRFAKLLIFSFFLVSVLLNLPKQYLLSLLL
ncbi:hypothetical protein ACFS7Z_06485 [Pontibacter toksunensis]|uniref:Dolichyl-phosphate-mannose-protein mannosyltransferase n=1 Tax=Pontibacter toksunensis TaxID=1332631 RepID=A0ABW6BQ99_9BACT